MSEQPQLPDGNGDDEAAEDEDAAYNNMLQDVATKKYGSNDIEIDPLEDEDISEGDNGVWVRGWLWLYNTDIGLEDDDSPQEDDCG